MNTGDAELLTEPDLEDWKSCHTADLAHVAALALPHHGSAKNSGDPLQALCPIASLLAHARGRRRLCHLCDLPKGCATIPVEGGTFALPLADIIDVDEEKARLEKTLGKLQKEIGVLNGRLKNPNFAVNAPEEVVEEAKPNLAAREDEAAKLTEALNRLAEIG
mgnify:FL=1|tara:strand:- start:7584 stop:8072 length:489 start_codon:yes stop_codon:yes gene_type:complete